MKNFNYLALLIVVAFMFAGCAVNKAPFQDYPAVTEVQLNQANYRIVGTAQGYSRQFYVLGIGGLSQKSLKENAIMDMYENANLKGSQAIVNITTSLTVSGLIPFYASKRASARGTIIEFLPEGNQPAIDTSRSEIAPQSVKIDNPSNESVKTSQANNTIKVTLDPAKEKENLFYLAYLYKIKKLNYADEEFKKSFDLQKIIQLSKDYSLKDLLKKSDGHDPYLQKYVF